MLYRELLNLGIMVLSASVGILVVALLLRGIIGHALLNGAALAAIAGVVCLVLAAVTKLLR